jgi:hypothetical protein|tara:strand:+ start:735 stop:950 length:216 start_codon:yes stop_codon:yes gene_type:complete
MKINTNISLENITVIIALVGSVILAFGSMKADVRLIQTQVDKKADKELIEYKFEVIMGEISEIKEILNKGK